MHERRAHPLIRILGYSEAAMLLERNDHGVAAILSICGTGEFAIHNDTIPLAMTLCFDDVEPADASDSMSFHRTWIQAKWAKESGRPLKPPTDEDVKAIVEFAGRSRSVGGVVLFQCQAGISRSSAAALICLAAWTGLGHEEYCMTHVRNARASAIPHAGLVKFADALLGREGLLTAVARHR